MAHPEFSERLPQQQLKILRSELMALFENEEPDQVDKSHSKGKSSDLIAVAQMLLNSSWQGRLGVTTVQLAQQQLDTYAKDKPFRLIGWSALLGFGLVIVKPWRYIPKGVAGYIGPLLGNRIYQIFSKS